MSTFQSHRRDFLKASAGLSAGLGRATPSRRRATGADKRPPFRITLAAPSFRLRAMLFLFFSTVPLLVASAAEGQLRTVRPAEGGCRHIHASGEPAPPATIPDWVHDALVVTNPAAAVGGCRARIYTPADNGVLPWREALIRWLTGSHVMGNSAVLVRQEGLEGGAGLSAVVDPNADYLFQVAVFVPGEKTFGDPQDKSLKIWVTVLDVGNNDNVIAEAPVEWSASDWVTGQVAFSSSNAREVRCVVRAKAPLRLPCFYFAEKFRLTRKDRQWWAPQNLFNASPTAVGLEDQRKRLLETLDPDVVGGHNGVYLNGDDFFTARGVAVGGGQWEQEYDTSGVGDPEVAPWLENARLRWLDGSAPEPNRLWRGYLMCHNAPEWHKYQQKRLARTASEVQMLSQDNIGSPSFLRWEGRACFCHGCCEGFRHWLSAQWTAGHLRSAGIAHPAAFDIIEYVKKNEKDRIAKGRDAVLADPVLRAYVQFQYASQLEHWRDTVTAVKQAAGHPIAICGNQWGAGGKRPYSVALSQIGDAAAVETGAGPLTSQQRAWDALASKTPLAAGEYRRPVWLYMTSLFHAPEAARSRLRMTAAQAWADGGIPTPWATAPGSSGWFYDTEAHLCRFVQKHRALFARRDRSANVALVYSLPTHAWRSFRAFKLSSDAYARWYVAWAQLLEEAHIPYEINCWWHPLLGDDRVSLGRLDRHQVLILPGVDCFTDGQRQAVRAFQARGGRVLTVASSACCDADAVPRPAGQALAAPGDQLLEVDPELLTRYARAGEKPSPETATEMADASRQLQAILRRAVANDTLLETDAPAHVWANLWLDDTRQVLALHLVNGVNGGIDVAADRFRPVGGTRWRVRLPAGLAVDRALAISPDESGDGETLPVEVAGGWATVVVPKVESYTIVALYRGNALTASANVAKARRAHWRASVIGCQPDAGFNAHLDKTLALLRAGQLAAGAPAAAELLHRTQSELKSRR